MSPPSTNIHSAFFFDESLHIHHSWPNIHEFILDSLYVSPVLHFEDTVIPFEVSAFMSLHSGGEDRHLVSTQMIKHQNRGLWSRPWGKQTERWDRQKPRKATWREVTRGLPFVHVTLEPSPKRWEGANPVDVGEHMRGWD